MMINYKDLVVQDDLKTLYGSTINWNALKNKKILVTGATGMLASYFSFMLMYLNDHHNYGIQIILLARKKENLDCVFGNNVNYITAIIQDVSNEIKFDGEIDFVLHAAGAASPYYIINDPVGIIKANTLGTLNVLELAKKAKTKKVMFTSTREVYGKVEGKEEIEESDTGTFDPLDIRSCYPESKRIAETLLKSFSLQYNIPFNALRIAHSYGPGMQIKNDGRVMADFLNSAVEQRDIQLNSSGNDERAFCYITDAVDAMFRVMIEGKTNEAYNIANETEPIKIIELAHLVQSVSGNQRQVIAGKDQGQRAGYVNYKRVRLNTSKLQMLGWTPKVSLREGLAKTLKSMER
jgi:UDP-glucuronate decarboxylase